MAHVTSAVTTLRHAGQRKEAGADRGLDFLDARRGSEGPKRNMIMTVIVWPLFAGDGPRGKEGGGQRRPGVSRPEADEDGGVFLRARLTP